MIASIQLRDPFFCFMLNHEKSCFWFPGNHLPGPTSTTQKKPGEPQTTIDNTTLVHIFLQQICPTEPIPRDRLNQILIQAHEVKAGCLGSWGPKLALRKFLKHSAFCVVNDILYI